MLVLLTAALAAGSCSLCADQVKITVVAILATDGNEKIDKEIECIAKEVRKKEPSLTGFKVERIASKKMKIGDREDFELLDRQKVTVEVRHGLNDECRIGLSVKPPRAGEITYSTCCNKCLPIVTRYVNADGQRLILAIKVQECGKK